MSFPSGLDFLANYPKLRTLNLSYLKTPLSSLAFLNHLPELLHLDLTGTPHNIYDFSPISSLSKLKTLTLRDFLPITARLPALSASLEELDISSSARLSFDVDEELLAAAPALPALPLTLRRLSLGGRVFASLAPVAGLENLEHLDLSSCRWLSSAGEAASKLEALANLGKLKTLNLMFTDNSMDMQPFDFLSVPESVEELRIHDMWNLTGIKLPRLRELHVHFLGTADLLDPFSAQLEILHLKKGFGASPQNVASVLQRMPKLREVWGLFVWSVGDLNALNELVNPATVKSLVIVENAEYPELPIADLRVFSNLEVFELTTHRLLDEAFLKNLAEMKSIKSLVFFTQNDSLHVVAEGLGDSLERLTIFGDMERTSLDDLRGFRKLKSLELQGFSRLQNIAALREIGRESLEILKIQTSTRLEDMSPLEELESSRKMKILEFVDRSHEYRTYSDHQATTEIPGSTRLDAIEPRLSRFDGNWRFIINLLLSCITTAAFFYLADI